MKHIKFRGPAIVYRCLPDDPFPVHLEDLLNGVEMADAALVTPHVVVVEHVRPLA